MIQWSVKSYNEHLSDLIRMQAIILQNDLKCEMAFCVKNLPENNESKQ